MKQPLVDLRIVLMPHLDIKLRLIRQFVKALNKKSAAFKHFLEFFPKLSEAKSNVGFLLDPRYKRFLNLQSILISFVGLRKLNETVFQQLSKAPGQPQRLKLPTASVGSGNGFWGHRMSFKLYILDAHLDKFKDDIKTLLEKQGELYYQNVKGINERHQGQKNKKMMGSYILQAGAEVQTELKM